MGSCVTSAFKCDACVLGVLCAVFITLLSLGYPAAAEAQISSYSVYLQEGRCGDLADSPDASLQAIATPFSTSGDAPTSTFFTFTLDSDFEQLIATPVSLIVDANRSEVGVTIACGEVSATSDNQAVVPIVSVETAALVGIGVLRPVDDASQVLVEIYLVVTSEGTPLNAVPETTGETDDDQDVVDDDDGSDAPEDEPEGGV